MTSIGIIVALLAGVVSFASPCSLPLVPAYVGYMVGSTDPDSPARRRIALTQSLAFVAGFTAVFVAIWASVGLVGYLVRDAADALRIVGGVVLIVMGLHIAELVTVPSLHRELRVPVSVLAGPVPGSEPGPGTAPYTVAPSMVRSSLLGVVFAAGWSPCVGPILGGIIGLASVSESVGRGTVLLLAYAVGLGIPFILVAVGAAEVNGRLGWFRAHHDVVSMVTGALLVVVGFLMITDLLARTSTLLPALGL
jgi:cytochrome c-type biogenesis protein